MAQTVAEDVDLSGRVNGVAVDAQDHIWVTHGGANCPCKTTKKDRRLKPPQSTCCFAAPQVLGIRYAAGNLLSEWGRAGRGYGWPLVPQGDCRHDSRRATSSSAGLEAGRVEGASGSASPPAGRGGQSRRRSPVRCHSAGCARDQVHAHWPVRVAIWKSRRRSGTATARQRSAGRWDSMSMRRRTGDLHRRRPRQSPGRRRRRGHRRVRPPAARLSYGVASPGDTAPLRPCKIRTPRPARRCPRQFQNVSCVKLSKDPGWILCLRPWGQPHPGVPKGRQKFVKEAHRLAGDDGRRVGVGISPSRGTRDSSSSTSPTFGQRHEDPRACGFCDL